MKSYNQWTEYDWEQWYQKNNEAAFRYLELFQKYHNLPASDALIKKECFEDNSINILIPDPLLPAGLDGVMWIPNEDILPDDDMADENFLPSFNENTTLQHPLCQALMQDIVNWANIYSLIIPDSLYNQGLITLFHLSRALTLVVYSIVDRNYPALPVTLMLIKRAHSHLSLAIKTIGEIEQKLANEISVITSVKGRLLHSCDLAIEHLLFCQKQNEARSE